MMQDDDFSVSNDYILQLEREISQLEKELNDDTDNASLNGRISGLKRALLIYRMLLKSKNVVHQINIEID
ncbi:hypothetical protein ACHHV8_02580 [Paenibacillus sp. TAB 01]|uniref:hypothetical protein n=1 Tax=Paenibacillus sp. TAB 01 TaxID=3368988 RepID=UPI0037521B8F